MQFEENFQVAIDGLLFHKIRSFLTILGIIFGVAAVIAMLSIGEGAKRQALEKYQDLGVNNIIIRDKDLSEKEQEEARAKFSVGLSLADAEALHSIVPSVVMVAPQAEKEIEAKYEDKSGKAMLIGITPDLKAILNYNLAKGKFIEVDHTERNLKVCVLGAEIARTLFPVENPLQKAIKLEDQWFEIVGVMETKALFTETVGELAARDLNHDIYIPLSTFLRRFSKKNDLDSELKQITIQLVSSENLVNIAGIIRRIMERRHYRNNDFNIIIPYELLKQEEKERQIYNVLLGSIAAISLLVGGIGIMNIMLATVSERTREIGVRRAIGATKKEILNQFMTEAVTLSLTGGLIGVFLGVTMSLTINYTTNFKTVITFFSVFIAFTVSGVVGIIFGMLPARKAANLNPIESLRYE
ncbi:ABC transporter permease [candidate division KSB1 bacterium]|nr:ABC transporter permease [candidate division KSB1 bacterium]